MVDYVKIKIKAGKGGSGAVSFAKQMRRSLGPPDGGDGGAGGNVYLEVGKDLTTLIPYRFKKNFQAEDGGRGAENHKKGAAGEPLVLLVPAGTKVTGTQGRLIVDLTKIGEKIMIAKGGKGGRGNAHVKKADFRIHNSKLFIQDSDVWRWHEEGEEGQEAELTLELKLLADVGLIGLPNAGKSTLLSRLTLAKPKIAAYPFTTIEPNLGVMDQKGKELVLADIPGLIEGASKGKGLGDQFLRHVERTRVLVHLVSVEQEDPVAAFLVVNKELKEHSKELINKPQVVCLTKIDMVDNKELKNKVSQYKNKRIKVIPISAIHGTGLEELKDKLISKF